MGGGWVEMSGSIIDFYKTDLLLNFTNSVSISNMLFVRFQTVFIGYKTSYL